METDSWWCEGSLGWLKGADRGLETTSPARSLSTFILSSSKRTSYQEKLKLSVWVCASCCAVNRVAPQGFWTEFAISLLFSSAATVCFVQTCSPGWRRLHVDPRPSRQQQSAWPGAGGSLAAVTLSPSGPGKNASARHLVNGVWGWDEMLELSLSEGKGSERWT